MQRQFVLLFVSTFITISFVRVPSLTNFLSTSWFAPFDADAVLAIASPPASGVPALSNEPSLPNSFPASGNFSDSNLSESNLPIEIRYRFYPIVGETASELRSQMLQQSPVRDAEGRSFDALTNWNVHWSFRYAQSGKHCAARSVDTHVDVLFTLPQWKVPRYASSDLQAEWSNYIQALQLHEEGHKKNGVDAAHAVLQALRQLPAYPDCRQLQKAAQETAAQAIAVYNQRDIEYDRATAHGGTQGAIFPIANASRNTAQASP